MTYQEVRALINPVGTMNKAMFYTISVQVNWKQTILTKTEAQLQIISKLDWVKLI